MNDIAEKDIEYTLTKWDGQISWYNEEAEFLTPKLIFRHKVSNKRSIQHAIIRVYGQIWDIEFNTSFKFGKAFEDMESASKFFDAFKEKYPNSKIYIQEELKVIQKSYR